MQSIAFALLVALLASSCLPPPPPSAATMAVNFDEHDIDCLSDEVRDEISRGQVVAEAAIAACDLARKHDAETVALEREDWQQQRAEMEGLRVWAGLAKGSLAAAVATLIAAGFVVLAGALRK